MKTKASVYFKNKDYDLMDQAWFLRCAIKAAIEDMETYRERWKVKDIKKYLELSTMMDKISVWKDVVWSGRIRWTE